MEFLIPIKLSAFRYSSFQHKIPSPSKQSHSLSSTLYQRTSSHLSLPPSYPSTTTAALSRLLPPTPWLLATTSTFTSTSVLNAYHCLYAQQTTPAPAPPLLSPPPIATTAIAVLNFHRLCRSQGRLLPKDISDHHRYTTLLRRALVYDDLDRFQVIHQGPETSVYDDLTLIVRFGFLTKARRMGRAVEYNCKS